MVRIRSNEGQRLAQELTGSRRAPGWPISSTPSRRNGAPTSTCAGGAAAASSPSTGAPQHAQTPHLPLPTGPSLVASDVALLPPQVAQRMQSGAQGCGDQALPHGERLARAMASSTRPHIVEVLALHRRKAASHAARAAAAAPRATVHSSRCNATGFRTVPFQIRLLRESATQ